ncbi:MFS transporter [Leucobacter chinensis]|uniref:MFS transporter n=1 Tax=Leucobacter chinensis TaxID=2851010 RepID=UPI0035109BF1
MSRRKDTAPRFLPWLVWGVAELMYIIAIINRTSLSALGPTAQDQFSIGAATLSIFAVLQLVVYAVMQIPVGLLLDRFGVTRVVLSGGLLMAIGQFGMAFAGEVWIAIVARMLVGAGDAFIFTSLMRLLPDWFPARKLPMLGQLTGMLGTLGQVVSLFPLSLAVGVFGWAAGFTGIAVACLFVVLVGAMTLRDTPGEPTTVERIRGKRGNLSERAELLLADGSIGLASLPSNTGLIALPVAPGANAFKRFFANMRVVLGIPGVRLAFWVHFSTPFSQHLMLLLWGTPLLVYGIGMTPTAASTVLFGMAITGGLAGLVLGRATSRYLEHRVHIAMSVMCVIAVAWGVLLLWPGTPPLWLVLTVTTITSMGGAASMIAFEIVRSHSPRRFIGLSTGTANMGGFIAALIAMLLVGIVLDAQGAGSPETFTMDAFRWAFATQYLVWIPALCLLVIELRKTLRWNEKNRGSGR